jgi:hypothetical protein
MRNRDHVFGLGCAADGERAGSRTKPNPCEQTFSSLICGNSSVTLDRQGISKLSPLLGVLWSMCLVQGLVGGGHYLSVNSSLSEKGEVQY